MSINIVQHIIEHEILGIGSEGSSTLSGLEDVQLDNPVISGQVLLWNGTEWTNETNPAGVTSHGLLTGLSNDDHTQYPLTDGSRGFTGTVAGVDPTDSQHLATKSYVDEHTQEVVVTPHSINVIRGILVSGDTASLSTLDDHDFLVINEQTGGPGLDLEFSFSGVEIANRIQLHAHIDGTEAHESELSIYNYNSSSWNLIETFTGSSPILNINSVINSENYIDINGNSKIRIYLPNNGNANHSFNFDYLALVKAGMGFTREHHLLQGLDHDDHQQYLLIDGSRSMNGDLNLGTHDIDNGGSVTAEEFISTTSGTINRIGEDISSIVYGSGRVLQIFRDNDIITSASDGIYTWTYLRDENDNLTGWTVSGI